MNGVALVFDLVGEAFLPVYHKSYPNHRLQTPKQTCQRHNQGELKKPSFHLQLSSISINYFTTVQKELYFYRKINK